MYQQYLNQAVSSLGNLSSDELKELLNDEDKLDERVNQAVSTLESEKDAKLDSNRLLAEENLQKEPELIERRGRINDLSENGKTLCANVHEKLEQAKSKSSNMNQETALALLQAAAAESEELSESIVKQLLDKELTVEQFIDQYMSARKMMHERKLKSEKMTDLIRQTTRNIGGGGINSSSGFYQSPTSSTGGLPYPMANSAGTPAGMPYPMGPFQMPMPNQFMNHY